MFAKLKAIKKDLRNEDYSDEPMSRSERVIKTAVGVGYLAVGVTLLVKYGAEVPELISHTDPTNLLQPNFVEPGVGDALVPASVGLMSIGRGGRHFSALQEDSAAKAASIPVANH